jgi:hypothetical protein
MAERAMALLKAKAALKPTVRTKPKAARKPMVLCSLKVV